MKRKGNKNIEVAVKSYDTTKSALDYEKVMEEVRILRKIRNVERVSTLFRVYESAGYLHIVMSLVKIVYL